MTSGVLTDIDQVEPPPVTARPVAKPRVPVSDSVRRRLARPSWGGMPFLATVGLVTTITLTSRLVNLRHPPGRIFDETYYAEEAHDLLQHGVEWIPEDNGPQYVVHPPLGKWMIALGESVFGYNSLGWRISAVCFGTLAVVMLMIIAQRLFRSTILAGAAGLLMALDGMVFVLSRSALLDVFLMFWIVAGFLCLVFDREQRRAGWLRALDDGLDTSVRGPAGRAKVGVPWWRLAAAVCLGAAFGVKWSAAAYILAFAVLVIVWEVGTRKTAGVRHAWRDALLDEIPWLLAFFALAFVVYLTTWSGWFLTDDGYFRHWYRDSHGLAADPPIIGALINLWHYHHEAFEFHKHLAQPHQYQSWPWQWLLLGRPVAFYWSTQGNCGSNSCASEILLLGTPLLWWSFLPALAGLAWLGSARRDWRAAAIGVGVAAGILPWFQYELDNRTMFYFYALPAEPFLVLAVVYVLGAIIGPTRRERPDSDQRLIGGIIAGTYVLLVAACFAYFYPLYTGEIITYADWFKRLWLGSRWV